MEDEKIDEFPIIHVRVMKQRRRWVTVIEGIPEEFDKKKMVKYWKKNYNCSGNIFREEEDEEDQKATVSSIRLTGNKKEEIVEFLEVEGITLKENIRTHGV